jgi:phosphonopyruvate decarboxylase
MGCASSVALGLAIARPELRIVVLDGDGALLMRMGALATIGFVAPSNLVHVLLDNGLHESTGGQLTVSESVDIEQVAAACGYASVHTIFTAEDLLSALQTQNHGPFFARVRILPGVAADLPRPDIGPVEVTQRLRDYLSNLS